MSKIPDRLKDVVPIPVNLPVEPMCQCLACRIGVQHKYGCDHHPCDCGAPETVSGSRNAAE